MAKINKFQVDLLLSCSHIIVLPVENILEVPNQGASIRCSICESKHTVTMVGNPYPIFEEETSESK